MFNIPGGIEWFILLGIAFLVFGGRLLRTFGTVGKCFMEFRNAARDVEDDIKKTTLDNIVEGMIYRSDIDKNKDSRKS